MTMNHCAALIMCAYWKKQYNMTVMWWYQCRKISFFLRRTMKYVSPSSGIFDRQNKNPHNPGVPFRRIRSSSQLEVLVGLQTEACHPFVNTVRNNGIPAEHRIEEDTK